MPNPTSQMMHQSQPLTDMSVLNQQEDLSFVLRQCGPFQPVSKQTNKYYVYDDGDWNRMVGALRGPSQESVGGGWKLSTGTYDCMRWAVHKDTDLVDAANADDAVAETDADAIDYLNNQAKIRGDYLLGTNVFAASIWTDDLDGTAGAGTVGTDFTFWNDSGGDPQSDVILYSERSRGRSGKKPNVFIAGAITHARILTNTAVRAAIKASDLNGPGAIEAKLASYLGVEKYIVAGAYRTTSAEGLADTIAYVLDSKAAWLGYVSPELGKKKMSAFRTFAFNGAGAVDGVTIRTMDIPEKTSTRHEIECTWDVKVINADCGVFFDAAVE